MRTHLKRVLPVILMMTCSLQAQTLTVRDAADNRPLQQVNIYSRTPLIFRATDSAGTADITAFQGVDSIHVELIGYAGTVVSYRDLRNMHFKVTLIRAPLIMDPVVVSASRWEQQQHRVPNRIASVTPQQRRLYMPQTAADMLEQGGIYIQKSQLGGGSPIIRGFSANRVLITVDGVRMNTAIFRSGNLQNVISLDPFAVQRTEILFGPGSVLYGSDAIGGVLHFTTLPARFANGGKPRISGEASVRATSANGERTGHADLRIGLAKWAFVTSITYNRFGHQVMGSNGPDDYLSPFYVKRISGTDRIISNPRPREQLFSGYRQYSLMQKIRFSPEEKWDIVWASHLSASSDIPRYDRLIQTAENGAPVYARWYYGPQIWNLNSLTVENSNRTPTFDGLKLIAAWQYFKESRHDRKYGSGDLRRRRETNRVLSVNLDLKKHLTERRALYYGLETILNRVGSGSESENITSGTAVAINPRYPDGSIWNSAAAYAKLDQFISDRLTVNTSLRYNSIYMKARFDTTLFPYPVSRTALTTGAVTGSIGALYAPVRNQQLRLNLSTGFRAPNIDDMGKVFDSEPGAVIVPNPRLQPEYAWNMDLSWRSEIPKLATWELTGYYIALTGAMVRRDATLNGQDSVFYDGTLSKVQHLTNAASARVLGIQASLSLPLSRTLKLSSRFSYQYGREIDGGVETPLRHAVPWFGTTMCTWSQGRVKADLYAQYSGGFTFSEMAPSEQNKPHLYAVDSRGRPWSPGWYTINLKIFCTLSESLSLSCGIENITDQRYRTYSSGIAAPGRNGVLMLTARY